MAYCIIHLASELKITPWTGFRGDVILGRQAIDMPNDRHNATFYMCASTMYIIVHLQAIASHLPVALIKDYDTGRWAHINVKLLHLTKGPYRCKKYTDI